MICIAQDALQACKNPKKYPYTAFEGCMYTPSTLKISTISMLHIVFRAAYAIREELI